MLNNILIHLKRFSWLMPFFIFISTYFILLFTFRPTCLVTPCLIGMPIQQALKELSGLQLGIHVMAIEHDAQLPEGMVMQQLPAPGRTIKKGQTIYVVLSEQPAKPQAPMMLYKTKEEIELAAAPLSLRVHYHSLPYAVPTGTCFAQWPAPHAALESKHMLCYVAAPQKQTIIWPDLVGMTCDEVEALLEVYSVQWHIEGKKRPDALVQAQQPCAGTIITLDDSKTIKAHLRVK